MQRTLTLTFGLLLSIVLFLSCDTHDGLTAFIQQEGYLDCFPENTMNSDSSLSSCEASAALYLKGKLYIASDKPIPDHASAFTFNFDGSFQENSLCYLDNNEIKSAFKFEDYSVLPDKRTILLSTGFDRIKKDTNSWDRYNCLLYWDIDTASEVKVLAKVDNKGVVSSARLRPYFQKALATDEFPEGTPYFKIEGVTTIPGNKLLFGVREKGENYNNFEYVFEIISVSYFWDKNEIVLKNDFEEVYKFTQTDELIEKPFGLSSLEYDYENNRIYALTTYERDETDEGVGGYLWYMSLDDFKQKKSPTLLKTKEGKPIKFAHKSEGLAIVDKNTLVIIDDDDQRVGRDSIVDKENQFSRTKNQAAYSIVKINDY